MLMLKRRSGESIILKLPNGDEVRFEISDIRKINVTVRIEAPRDVKIYRNELIEEPESVGHLWKGE